MNDESLGDRYRLVRLIASGGMGSVYEGMDLATGSRVAIKMLHDDGMDTFMTGPPSSFSRLKREAQAMMKIDTPHIASVLDTGTHQETGAPYLVLELLEGEDLQQTIDRLGPLPPPFALKVVAQACLGLHAAHAAGFAHRDIKPANLFLARKHGEIVVKLLDFGLAKLLGRAGSAEVSSTLTDSGTMLGSPYYMSPEQLRSAKQSNHLTDIWSIGAVLYCALTGRPPHAEITFFVRLVAAICGQQPQPVRQRAPWVTPEVAQIVERAMEADLSQRYPSALAMLEALRRHLPDGFALREETSAPHGLSAPSRPSAYSSPPGLG